LKKKKILELALLLDGVKEHQDAVQGNIQIQLMNILLLIVQILNKKIIIGMKVKMFKEAINVFFNF